MKKRIWISIIAGLCILLFGIGSMMLLTMLRRPPAEVVQDEKPLRVQAVRLVPEDVPVVITGYGYGRALNAVDILPEVSGKIIEIYPNLEVGTVVPRCETLMLKISSISWNELLGYIRSRSMSSTTTWLRPRHGWKLPESIRNVREQLRGFGARVTWAALEI